MTRYILTRLLQSIPVLLLVSLVSFSIMKLIPGDPAILIGGPDGLDPALKARADETIRLSSLTLPHPLVRVLLAEQLYRGWSILAGHPYHRE